MDWKQAQTEAGAGVTNIEAEETLACSSVYWSKHENCEGSNGNFRV